MLPDKILICLYFCSLGYVSHCLAAHPLRLSLCEIEYKEDKQLLKVNLKLFLTDVNEALVFDPESRSLRFCEKDESKQAEPLLLKYLNNFFYIKVNGIKLPLTIKTKKLSGDGDNTALWLFFEYDQKKAIRELEIRDDVFTDLFFDQSNLVYVHAYDKPRSLMLNKKTPVHTIKY